MLYKLHELQRSFLNPLTAFAEAGAKLFANPHNPLSYLPFANRVAAGYELFFRLGKEYEKPQFGLHVTTVDNVEVPVLEHVEIDKAFCKLLHFERYFPKGHRATRTPDPKVLVFAPLSGHH